MFDEMKEQQCNEGFPSAVAFHPGDEELILQLILIS